MSSQYEDVFIDDLDIQPIEQLPQVEIDEDSDKI